MPYLRESAVRGRGVKSLRPAEWVLREASSGRPSQYFDVFLSHSFLDAELVLRLKELLEDTGLTVYVDWIDDNDFDRRRVTPATADRLRLRMEHSRSLIFAVTESSPSSKWMPWELGYFDGHKSGHVAILPLVDASPTFLGQEYVGLYPHVKVSDLSGFGLYVSSKTSGGASLSSFVAHGATA